MVRRLLTCAPLLVLICALAQPALADNDKGGGKGNGRANSESSESPGKSGESPGHSGESPGKSGESRGKSGEGDAPGKSGEKRGKAGDPAEEGKKKPEKKEAERALEAVQSHDAVPFRTILSELRRNTSDKVIDAHLLSSGDELVYELKVLGPEGRVRVIRYDARTGRQIGPE